MSLPAAYQLVNPSRRRYVIPLPRLTLFHLRFQMLLIMPDLPCLPHVTFLLVPLLVGMQYETPIPLSCALIC